MKTYKHEIYHNINRPTPGICWTFSKDNNSDYCGKKKNACETIILLFCISLWRVIHTHSTFLAPTCVLEAYLVYQPQSSDMLKSAH